jgi:hypothetical protein
MGAKAAGRVFTNALFTGDGPLQLFQGSLSFRQPAAFFQIASKEVTM